MCAACVYGDPHIVTLDGHKYTFNGKGEFTMISTEDNQFTLQGRMVEATDMSGNNASATVFSSLVAKEAHSDVVQVDLSPIGLIARVNGEEVDFADNPLQDFNNVTVADRGNQTLSAVFLNNGAYIEVKVENEIISVVLVSLPVSYKGTTQGLMGNYNGNTSDDLMPQGGGEAIPVDSSLKDIHEQFGITCKYSTSRLHCTHGNVSLEVVSFAKHFQGLLILPPKVCSPMRRASRGRTTMIQTSLHCSAQSSMTVHLKSLPMQPAKGTCSVCST